ncbi:hypothetical protein KIPB_014074, partial [Kipferlia bialata]
GSICSNTNPTMEAEDNAPQEAPRRKGGRRLARNRAPEPEGDAAPEGE